MQFLNLTFSVAGQLMGS